jgi:hypothetical protein
METDEKEAPLVSYREKETKKMVSSFALYDQSEAAASSTAKKSLDLKRTEDRMLSMMRELMQTTSETEMMERENFKGKKKDIKTGKTVRKKVVYKRIEKYIRHFFDRLLETFQTANTNRDQVLLAQARVKRLEQTVKQHRQTTWSAEQVGKQLGNKLNLSLKQLDSRTSLMKKNRDAYTR